MYRAYHAYPRGLTGPDGRSTNAVFGFITMLRKLMAEQSPELIAAAFDLKGPTFRHELAGRLQGQPASDTRRPRGAGPWVHDACAALGVSIVTRKGFEADDVIGSLAARGSTSPSG